MEIVSGQQKTIKQQAIDELVDDKTKEFKKSLKCKLKELQDAKVIVKNLEREVDFLEKKIDQEIKDING